MDLIPSDQVALRFANEKGWELIGYADVAFEIQVLKIEALVIEKQSIPPIQEFLLKGIDIGLNTTEQLSGAFGIEDELVKTNLIECHRDEYIDLIFDGTGNSSTIKLSESGQELCRTLKVKKKSEATFEGVYFHGLKRNIIRNKFASSLMLDDSEVKEQGIITIAAKPAKTPEPDEISCPDLSTYERKRLSIEDEYYFGDTIVLKALTVAHQRRIYIPAVLLQYRPVGSKSNTSECRTAFAVNGELDLPLEEKFSENSGLKDLPKFQLEKPPTEEELLDGIMTSISPDLDILKGTIKTKEESRLLLNEIRDKYTKKTKNIVTAEASRQQLLEKYKNAKSIIADLEMNILDRGYTLFLPAWEHPGVLVDTLSTAKERVILVTAFMSKNAFKYQPNFVTALKQCLKKGVQVTFIYGVGIHGRKGPINKQRLWEQGVKFLKSIQQEFEDKFTLIDAAEDVDRRETEGTHEKMLVKDNDYIVVGSYNWLSRTLVELKRNDISPNKYNIGGEASLITSNKTAMDCCLNHIKKQYL